MFSSLICFYLFFLYISFGTFFGQGIATASQRGVKQCNQNMESDILRQHSLALSPWPSKPLLNPTTPSRLELQSGPGRHARLRSLRQWVGRNSWARLLLLRVSSPVLGSRLSSQQQYITRGISSDETHLTEPYNMQHSRPKCDPNIGEARQNIRVKGGRKRLEFMPKKESFLADFCEMFVM